MNKLILSSAVCSCLVSSCEKVTPQNYFDRAVLSSNLMHGFAGEGGIERELKQPSIKLVDPSGSETVQMTRKEVVEKQLVSLEHSYGRLKQLDQTDDNREMVQASLLLHEYVLPVYRDEYKQLARLYDEGAPPKEIEAFRQSIQQKYLSGFQTRRAALSAAGKSYADRHGIRVDFGHPAVP